MASTATPLVSRDFLMRVLVSIQNVPSNWDRDIVTFSAFLDDAEMADHILREFSKLPEASRKLVFELARERRDPVNVAA
jgi:hypothetical protein